MPLLGVLVGLTPMWIHLAVAGIGPSWRGMVIEPVRDLRPGRELPRPPSFDHIDGALQAVAEGPLDAPWWRFPALSANHQLFLWFFVVIIVAVRAGADERLDVPPAAGSRRGEPCLMAGSLLSLGMLPQALQRPDSTHLAWGSCISLALVPALVRELLDLRAARGVGCHGRARASRTTDIRRDVVAGAVLAVLLFVVAPFYTYRYYLLYSRISVGNKPGGFEVQRDDRRFYFGNEPLQRASQAAIDDLDRLSQPGDRLLVGPADLAAPSTATWCSTTCSPSSSRPRTSSRWTRDWPTDRLEPRRRRRLGRLGAADQLLDRVVRAERIERVRQRRTQPGGGRPVLPGGQLRERTRAAVPGLREGDGVSPAGIGIGAERRASLDHELAERG